LLPNEYLEQLETAKVKQVLFELNINNVYLDIVASPAISEGETDLTGFMFTLCHGINKSLDAIISSIQQTQVYLNQISQGKILKEISGNYQDDFLSIKQSLEQSVSSINLLISDSRYLVESALQGQL